MLFAPFAMLWKLGITHPSFSDSMSAVTGVIFFLLPAAFFEVWPTLLFPGGRWRCLSFCSFVFWFFCLSVLFVCSVVWFGCLLFRSNDCKATTQKKKKKNKHTQKTEPPTSELNHPRPTKQWETWTAHVFRSRHPSKMGFHTLMDHVGGSVLVFCLFFLFL